MNKNIKKILDRVKDIPGIKVGFVLCNSNTMSVDSLVLEYDSAKEFLKGAEGRYPPGWGPDEIMPVLWIDDEEDVKSHDEREEWWSKFYKKNQT